MSYSSLVTYKKLSPNCTKPRNHKIDTITIHCTAGNGTAESILNLSWFVNYNSTSGSSCNYAIGYDGSIGLCVEEENRSWCSSNRDNDQRAITIEVSSSNKYPYAVSDAAYKALIDLLVDICKRNNIPELRWKADKNLIGQIDKQNMTVHRWFANKECPGEYLYSRHEQIASEVNARLSSSNSSESEEQKLGTNDNYTEIVGDSVANTEQMIARLKTANPDVPQSVIDMIPYYISEGKTEGIRGDIAFAQSCIETGNFAFPNCNVTMDQNNFCGMGVVTDSSKGNSFETPQLGIRAQIQHLKAYASTDPLIGKCVDPRFTYVTRGCAPYVEWLGMKENPQGKGWASAKDYGSKILRVLDEILSIQIDDSNSTAKPSEKSDEETNTSNIVKVSIPDLEIRKGPGTNYDKTGLVTGKGVFTIVEECDGWGKLKSGAGWIPLSLVNPDESDEKCDLPYKVKVEISYLNIRKGPGTNYAKTGLFTGIGVFTIVEVQKGEGSDSGWGKLKSGAGWISLDYAHKV